MKYVFANKMFLIPYSRSHAPKCLRMSVQTYIVTHVKLATVVKLDHPHQCLVDLLAMVVVLRPQFMLVQVQVLSVEEGLGAVAVLVVFRLLDRQDHRVHLDLQEMTDIRDRLEILEWTVKHNFIHENLLLCFSSSTSCSTAD